MSCPTTDVEAGSARERRRDAFFRGGFVLHQPVGSGFRSGHDALLLAATVPPEAEGRLCDVGAGSGAVGFAAAVRAPGLCVTLLEADPEMAECARAGLADPSNAAFASRIKLAEIDLFAPARDRGAAGVPSEGFDFVLTNPPYHPTAARLPADPLRRRALHVAGGAAIGDWIRSSLKLLRSGGVFSVVLRADALGELLAAIAGRAGSCRIVPVHADPAAPAARIVASAVKGSRAPLELLAPRRLREADGTESEFGRAISRGTADLRLH